MAGVALLEDDLRWRGGDWTGRRDDIEGDTKAMKATEATETTESPWELCMMYEGQYSGGKMSCIRKVREVQFKY